jgi:hypothetical protein
MMSFVQRFAGNPISLLKKGTVPLTGVNFFEKNEARQRDSPLFQQAVSRVIWDGPTAQDADSLLAAGNTPEQHSRLQEAVVFLRSFLGNCPRSATDVFKAAATAGITPMTLRRAKEKLDIYSCRQRYSYDGYWQWVLPGWQSSCVCVPVSKLGSKEGNAPPPPSPNST